MYQWRAPFGYDIYLAQPIIRSSKLLINPAGKREESFRAGIYQNIDIASRPPASPRATEPKMRTL